MGIIVAAGLYIKYFQEHASPIINRLSSLGLEPWDLGGGGDCFFIASLLWME
jgi:hypothetical protein